jgi:hypothetical protein
MKLSSGVVQTPEDEISTRTEIYIGAETLSGALIRSPNWVEILA